MYVSIVPKFIFSSDYSHLETFTHLKSYNEENTDLAL